MLLSKIMSYHEQYQTFIKVFLFSCVGLFYLCKFLLIWLWRWLSFKFCFLFFLKVHLTLTDVIIWHQSAQRKYDVLFLKCIILFSLFRGLSSMNFFFLSFGWASYIIFQSFEHNFKVFQQWVYSVDWFYIRHYENPSLIFFCY
jgi:hypothetical protein